MDLSEKVANLYGPVRRDSPLTGPGADLDGEDLLPGFRYPIADLFKAWDWENE